MSGDRIRDDYEAQPSGWLREPSAAPRYIQRVGIEDDVAKWFFTDESVNRALHRLIDEGRAPAPREVEFWIPRSVLEDYELPAEWQPDPRKRVPRPVFAPMPDTQVSVELDLIRYFKDSDAVNAALRMLIAEGAVPGK